MKRVACNFLFALGFVLVAGPLWSQQNPQPAALPGQPAASYKPITGSERLRWVVTSTVGPRSLGLGVLSAGWGTMLNRPEEYGPGWEGFGERYGMRLTGVSTGNAMEAAGGAVLGRIPDIFVWHRLRPRQNIIKMTFYAHYHDGWSRGLRSYGSDSRALSFRYVAGRERKGADQALVRSGWEFSQGWVVMRLTNFGLTRVR
jgi:hypothetical protein